MFKENVASVGQPSTAWGWVLNDEKSSVSRGGLLEKQDQCPDSLRPPPPPSAACGWVLSVGTGLPLQTPPDFLIVIYKVKVVGVVYCSHTPEESAD